MRYGSRTTQRIIASAVGVASAVAQGISAAVGWRATLSGLERVANIVAVVLIGALGFAVVIAAYSLHALARRLLTPSGARIDSVIAASRDSGLLPDSYVSSPERDRWVARMITFDRKAGLTEQEIRKDITDLLERAAQPVS